jgi:hypothetical protein
MDDMIAEAEFRRLWYFNGPRIIVYDRRRSRHAGYSRRGFNPIHGFFCCSFLLRSL